jgi:hypothetical protein
MIEAVNKIIEKRILRQNEKEDAISIDKPEEIDEYWSDFSDEDFTWEEQEEKEAIANVYRFQQWLSAL